MSQPKYIFFCLTLSISLLLTASENQPTTRNTILPTGTQRIERPILKPAIVPKSSFHWQLSDYPVDTSVEADYFGVDLFETSIQTITTIHEKGAMVICYLNAGAWEEYRPDANDFPTDVIGKDYSGWSGEKWLDIHHYDRFAAVIQARMDLAVQKGCDGIDADNVMGFQEDTGFPISAADQLAYNRWLSERAHARDLLIALKNDPDQVPDLVESFDLAIIEDCLIYDFCGAFAPFIAQGKPVLQIEYTDHLGDTQALCASAEKYSYAGLLKHRELDAWSQTCP